MARVATFVVAVVAAALVTGPHPPEADARSEAAATRIVYSSDWMGPSQLFAVDPAGRAAAGQVTFDRQPGCVVGPASSPCGFSQPLPSPDGRWIAYRNRAGALFVARADGSRARQLLEDDPGLFDEFGPVTWTGARTPRLEYVVRSANGPELRSVRGDGSNGRVVFRCKTCRDPTRSPDARAVAFAEGSDVVVHRAGKVLRIHATSPSQLAWSPDGRRIGFHDGFAVSIASVTGTPRIRTIGSVEAAYGPRMWAWSPDGQRVAFASRDGLHVHEVRTGRTRLLTSETAFGQYRRPVGFAWSPDGRSLAYVPGTVHPEVVRTGPLRTVTLAGATRTIVDANRAYGGHMLSVAWVRVPAGARYRQPEHVPMTRADRDGVLASGPVVRLAADGERVAFQSCGYISVWSTATGEAGVGSSPDCSSGFWGIYSFAIAGERVGYAVKPERCLMYALMYSAVASTASVELGRNLQCSPQAYSSAFGHFVGAGPLLVFSRWNEIRRTDGSYETTLQEVLRAPPGGCPCPTIASSPGPLVPADVNAGRVVAYGTNATLVLDAEGRTLLSVPVSPLAAQLAGDDLVLLERGRLRVYDASTGVLRGAYDLPDVPSGSDGGGPRYERYRLELHDAAHGLAVYVFDGRIHVVRLSDGTDVVVGYGTNARFIDAGLVFADHARIRLVRYADLPVR